MLSVEVSATGIWCIMYPEFGWCAGIGSKQQDTMCVIFRWCREFEEVADFKLPKTHHRLELNMT